MFTCRARGFTLVEMVAVLALVAVGASALAPTARRLADLSAVLEGREQIVRALTRARVAAVASGGSVVTVHASPPRARIIARGTIVRDVPLGDGRLAVRLTAGRDSLAFRYDRLGIGRFTSGSLVLSRGDAEAGLVVSSYGRVRRR